MPEYIEKHAVVNILIDLENEFQQYKPFHGFEHAMYRKLCEAEITIGKTPAADVAPVRHGRWEKSVVIQTDTSTLYNYTCSECSIVTTRESDFCPNCGAIMDLK